MQQLQQLQQLSAICMNRASSGTKGLNDGRKVCETDKPNATQYICATLISTTLTIDVCGEQQLNAFLHTHLEFLKSPKNVHLLADFGRHFASLRISSWQHKTAIITIKLVMMMMMTAASGSGNGR